MKRVKIIGFPMFINPQNQQRYTEAELRAMNCLYEDVVTVKDDYDKVALRIQLEESNAELKTYVLRFEELD